MLDLFLGILVAIVLFSAYRYVKKHGKCTGCSGCKPHAHPEPSQTQPPTCTRDCSQCKHCSSH